MTWINAYVLYIVSFLDLMAVSMIIPSLASYVRGMDGGALSFGAIMSMYGFIQFFSAPLAGSLSDNYGRRRVLLACFIGASFGYLLLGASWNIYMVILSRIPPALFKHSLDLIKVAATDGLDPTGRSATIGKLNAASSAGFIVGPVIGGYVSAIPNGFNYTALLTTSLFVLNYVLISLFYSEPKPLKRKKSGAKVSYAKFLINKLFEFTHIVHQTGPVKTLLLARLLLATSAILYRTNFSTMLEDKFGTDSKARGFVLSYMGVLGAFASYSVGFITKRIRSERLLLQVASVVYVLTFWCLSLSKSLRSIYLFLIPQVVSISVLRACSIGLQTVIVSPEHIGGLMGISSSLTSIARTIAPILSGWTYIFAVDGPAYGAALLASISAGIFLLSPHIAKLEATDYVPVTNAQLAMGKP